MGRSQCNGFIPCYDTELACEDIGFSLDSRLRITVLVTEQSRRQLFQSAQGSSQEELRKKLAELTRQTDEKIVVLLTDEL